MQTGPIAVCVKKNKNKKQSTLVMQKHWDFPPCHIAPQAKNRIAVETRR